MKYVLLYMMIIMIMFLCSTNGKINADVGEGCEDKWEMATDSDFVGTKNGEFKYVGKGGCVEIPDTIKGVNLNSYEGMFADSFGAETKNVKGVKSTNPNIINMISMFHGSQATELDLSELETKNVLNMPSMFRDSRAIRLDLSSFETPKLLVISNMFNGSQAKEINVSSFDTSNVTNMAETFKDTEVLTLDLSNFDTSKVENMNSMFNGSKAKTIDVSSFKTQNVTGMKRVFRDTMATEIDVSNFDTRSAKEMTEMFNLTKVLTLDLSKFDTSKVENMDNMFSYSQLTNLDLSNFDTSNVTSMAEMFRNTKISTLDLSNFDTSKVENMNSMFNDSEATTIDVSSFNTVNVTGMKSVFRDSKVTKLDLSGFDTSNVSSMTRMFQDSQITSLDLSEFKTNNVTDMSRMFVNSLVEELDLSSFDTSNVTDMGYMFSNSKATIGYSRTIEDAERFNNTLSKPDYLNFIVKGTPLISFEPNGSNTYNKNHSVEVNVNWSGSEKEVLEYQWTNRNTFPISGNWTVFDSGDTLKRSGVTGNYYLHINAKSKFGIDSKITSNFFKLDNSEPVIKIENDNSWLNEEEEKEIKFSVQDEHSGLESVKYYWSKDEDSKNEFKYLPISNDKNEINEYSLEVPKDGVGKYELFIIVKDEVGNVKEMSTEIIRDGKLYININDNKDIFFDHILTGVEEERLFKLETTINDTRINKHIWSLNVKTEIDDNFPGEISLGVEDDFSGNEFCDINNEKELNINCSGYDQNEINFNMNFEIEISDKAKVGKYSDNTITYELISVPTPR